MNDTQMREIVENTIESWKKDAASKATMTLERAEILSRAVLEEARRIGVQAVVCVSAPLVM